MFGGLALGLALIIAGILISLSERNRNKEELQIYADGIVHCSVCTNIKSEKRIEELVNKKNPTGIESKWVISKDDFGRGEPNPSPCNHKPKTHKHYLMEC